MRCPCSSDAELGSAILPAWEDQSWLQKVAVWLVDHLVDDWWLSWGRYAPKKRG